MKRCLSSFVSSLALASVVWAAEPVSLIRVERRGADDLSTLRAAGIPVVLETRPSLFVRGGASNLAILAARGYKAAVLDPDVGTSDYLIVGLRPDSNIEAVQAAGRVLLAEENWILIRVPAGTSHGPIEDARTFVGSVPTEPAAIPKPAPSAPDSPLVVHPIVQKIVANVAEADIQAYWQALASNPPTGTRFSTTQGCRDASTYCFNTYAASKVPAQYQNWSAGNAPNVIGTLTGATNPGNVYILVAHLDDLPSSGLAPGADDNGSGSAAVLEAAKAISCYGVRNTLKFLNVTGEEQGLFGSDAYAADAATRGENILGVINYDMIGWQGDGIPAGENLDLDYNAPSQWLAQRFVDAAATYGTGLAVNPILCPSLTVSDHYPFWQRGWSAICGITDNEGYCGAAGNYPFYHQSTDTIPNNGNPAFFYKVVKTTVATLAELGDPFRITFSAGSLACGAPIAVTLADKDLNTAAGSAQSSSVHVWSTSEPAGETLTVTERGLDSLLFDGTMPTTAGPAVGGDGFLSVVAGSTNNTDYVDALDCDSSTNVAYSATATVDCASPLITGVAATNVTGNSARITWATDEASTSVVHYGTTPPGGQTASSASLVAAHDIGLTGLSECTPYSFWVQSADGVGNTASDDAGGSYYTFATLKNTNPDYLSADTPIPIPDNNATGGTSTINVTDDRIVQDINVKVNITHTYDGDLLLTLIPPVGSPITLSNHRGGNGQNFTNAVFDDAAATPIASGSAPFTGTFRPDTPLSAANGIHSVGAWKLKAVDNANQDTGSIVNWTLNLTYPSMQCGPHAAYTASSAITDTCPAGGAGNGNGTWDPGERVQFRVTVANDGSAALTGVTATLTSSTPGVMILDGIASLPDLAIGASADSLAPHFKVYLPSSLACGSQVAFSVAVTSAQGSWSNAFTRTIGSATSGTGTALNETFSAPIPTWTIVSGGSGADTWTTANPGNRSIAAPMSAPVAVVDSDSAGASATQDEQLITPVMNLSIATSVTLEFDQYFQWYSGGQNERGDVDVRSSQTAGAWINVFRNQGASSPNPEHKTLNITAQAAGAADVQVRFRYYQAAYEWYWQVDNVKVTFAQPPGCSAAVCAGAAPAPPPVPDGTFGTPMLAARAVQDGSIITLSWDVASCVASGYKAIYGTLSTLSGYTVSGAACALGTTGGASWNGVPPGDLWFVVVGSDGAGTEGSWGNATSGPMGGVTPSLQCGDVARDHSGTCP